MPPDLFSKLVRILNRANDAILLIFASIAAGILVLLMLMTVAKVFMRSVLGTGILGTDQISGTLMVYMTFLGAAWVLRNNGHVAIDILTSNLRPNSRRIVALISCAIGAIVCFALAYFGTIAVVTSMQRGIMVAAELEIPRAVNLVVIPIGGFLLGVEFVRQMLAVLHELKAKA